MAKRERRSRAADLALYGSLSMEDTRYWGLFRGETRIGIDPKRLAKEIPGFLTEGMLKIVNARNTHHFVPKKAGYFDYNVNCFVESVGYLRKKWLGEYKPLINEVISKIAVKQLDPGGDYKLMCGISGYGAASARTQYQNMVEERKAAVKKNEIIASMYSQFYSMMASQIEAATVRVLTKNNLIKGEFHRNLFYETCKNKKKKFNEIDGFSDYDKLYCIWNFIKHNNESTYKDLRKKHPEVLWDGEYLQGQLAIGFVKFDDALIEGSLDGVERFFKNYCELVFGEDYSEAQWNYDGFFENEISSAIDDIANPLGLDVFDDMD